MTDGSATTHTTFHSASIHFTSASHVAHASRHSGTTAHHSPGFRSDGTRFRLAVTAAKTQAPDFTNLGFSNSRGGFIGF